MYVVVVVGDCLVSRFETTPTVFSVESKLCLGAICLDSASVTSPASVKCIAWSNDRSSLSSLRCVLLLLIPQTSWSRSASPRNSPKLQVDASRRSSAANAVTPSLSFWVRWWHTYLSHLVLFSLYRHCKPTWLQMAFQCICHFLKRQICRDSGTD